MNEVKAFRHDVIDKVTGNARYGGDYSEKGMLYAKICWSPAICARIIKIDTAQAEKAPGVVRILTRKNIHGMNLAGMIGEIDHPILIGEGEVARYAADAVALVAAESEDAAARACDLIDIEYEALPEVNDVAAAKAMGLKPCVERSIQKGDVAACKKNAAITVEEDYFIPYQEHAYLEPEGGVATFDNNGVVNVYCGTQNLYANQRAISKALGYPTSKVRMHAQYTGGGFGGKHSISVQVWLALLAHELRRCVKLVWTREESMICSCKKQETFGNIRLSLDEHGHICAIEGLVEGPSAPYIGNSGDDINGVMGGMVGPYRIPSIDLKGYMYETTGPELGAFRGVGAPDGVFVLESMLTKAGAGLGLDQAEIRRRNWVEENKEFENITEGSLIRQNDAWWSMPKVMDDALKAAGPLPEAARGKRVGRGIANAKAAYMTGNTWWHAGTVVQLDMFLDGSVVVRCGFSELGQGISGVLIEIVAKELGIEKNKIELMLADGHASDVSGALGFSQATVACGHSAILAAKQLKEKLVEVAKRCIKSEDDTICFKGNAFYNGKGEQVLSWEKFEEFAFAQVESLSGKGRFVGSCDMNNEYAVTPIVCVADIEVDEDTGEIRVLQIIHAHDIGKIIHYDSARGQILGAAVMAMGGTLHEEYVVRNGRSATPSLAEYIIPTAMDVPEKNKVVFYEGNSDDYGPYGAKGLGEHGMYCVAAAINNALFDACGFNIMQLPITPEKVLRSMKKI